MLVLRAGSFLQVRPETRELLTRSPPGILSEPQVLANDVSPDGSLLATSDPDGRMRLLDLESLTWIGDSDRDAGGIVRFGPDGTQFAALQGNRVRLWDGHSGEYHVSIPLPDQVIRAYGWLPDSSGLILAAADGRTWTADARTDQWAERACGMSGRNLTRVEWQHFFPSRPYATTCPQWPAGS